MIARTTNTEAGEPRLVGGRCTSCGHATFPVRAVCPVCGSPMEEEAFGPGATVESIATLHVSTDEAEAPYSVGMLLVDDGPRLLSRIEGAGTGDRARLVTDPDEDVFWFASEADESE